MAEVGREEGKLALDIEPCPVRIDKRADGKTVPQIVDTRPAWPTVADSGPLHEAEEGKVDVLVEETSSSQGEEERRTHGPGEAPVPMSSVGLDRFQGRRVERDRPEDRESE